MDHHHKWDEFVIDKIGGLTLGEVGRGKWKDGLIEGFIKVDIACHRWQLMKILGFTKEHYKQEAIMCYKLSDEVIIYDDSASYNQSIENEKDATDLF